MGKQKNSKKNKKVLTVQEKRDLQNKEILANAGRSRNKHESASRRQQRDMVSELWYHPPAPTSS